PNLSEPIVDTTDLVLKSIDWASKLNNSYLPIQGPPGSGKSFTGSHLVLELIKKGKKIGITALSHKVIINLLDKVQKLAVKQGIAVSIIYKGSSNDNGDYSWEMTKNIDTIASNIAKYQVIAGTSFMWCNEKLKK